MKVLKESKEKNKINYEIEEDYEKLSKEMDIVFSDLVKKAKIPGFRKGKVPRNIFEKHYGRGVLLEKATTNVMNKVYPQLIKEKDLKPIDYPQDVKLLQVEENKPFKFSLSVPVPPEVKLGKYKGIKIKKVDDKVTDKDVQAEIDSIRDKYAEFEEVTDQPVSDESFVQYDMKATSEGEAIEEWTKEDSGTKIGANMVHEDFDKELVGTKIGETKKFSIKFPKDYKVEPVQDKKVDFEVTIKEIKEKKLPELNEEFVKKISQFDSPEEFKKDLKERMQKQKETEAKNQMREELIGKIIEDIKIDIPEVMVQREIDNMLRNFDQTLRNSGLTLENYLKFSGKDMDSIKQDYHEPAVKKVKADLAVEKIKNIENIEVTDEEAEEEINQIAERSGADPKEFKDKIGNDYKEYIKSYKAYDKTIDFLMENAKLTK